jgi:hypothetical protein
MADRKRAASGSVRAERAPPDQEEERAMARRRDEKQPREGVDSMYAAMTIMHYPPSRTDDVYRHIRDVLIPYHNRMTSDGLVDALFFVNPESCQGIGLAIFNEAAKLRELERGTSREMARQVRDPGTAPTPYTRDRAKYVGELAGGIVSADWYEVVGQLPAQSGGSTLFPSGSHYHGKGRYAAITVMHYPPRRTDDVYKHITEVLIPRHEEMRSDGLTDAIFLVNPESCQGIGIAIFEEASQLRSLEGGTTRDMARAVRDPESAPTQYTAARAKYVEDLGGSIVTADWYEVVGRAPTAAGAGSTWEPGGADGKRKDGGSTKWTPGGSAWPA